MANLNNFNLVFDPNNFQFNKVNKAHNELGDSPPAIKFFIQHPRVKVFRSKSALTEPEFLLGVTGVFGRVVPTIAEYIGFTKTAEKGFYQLNPSTKELTLINPDTAWGEDPVLFRAINISEYYNGKPRIARDDAGNEWTCRITITDTAWSEVESQRTAADPATIKGILANDKVWISPVSKKKGDRCIKPEPYGWIFSTNGSVRLVDPTTNVLNNRPAALTFTTVQNVK